MRILAAWAEHRRVKGVGRGARALSRRAVPPEGSTLPSSIRVLEHPLSSSPGWEGAGARTHRACDDQGCLLFHVPAKGRGRRAARVLGSLRRFMNRAWDRSHYSSDRSVGHAARERALQYRQTSAFSTTGTRPVLTEEARHLWLGRCPRESFSQNPGDSIRLFGLFRGQVRPQRPRTTTAIRVQPAV